MPKEEVQSTREVNEPFFWASYVEGVDLGSVCVDRVYDTSDSEFICEVKSGESSH